MDAYASFRTRDFKLLLTGNFLATLGLQMVSVAVSWDLYLETKSAVVLGKTHARINERSAAFLAHPSFCLLATTDADGQCDVSPRG